MSAKREPNEHGDWRCSKCKKWKPSIRFSKLHGRPHSWCKSCVTAADDARPKTSKNRESVKRRHAELRANVIKKFDAKCKTCGFSDARALQIDHVGGFGRQDVARFPSATAYLKAVIEDGAGRYQLLCANCNMIKAHDLKQRPGGKKRTKERPMAETRELF